MNKQINEKLTWYRRLDFWLLAILLLALFLNAWGIWDAGNANAYYTAAVKSMTENWKAFFYGSLDPQNYITVDKPPVALWFMALICRIFGVHGWSVVLSSVLFGVASTYLMYRLVAPKFGLWAGRLSAFILTITPIAVADNRTNNMDTTLIFFLLLGIYFLQKAVEKKQIRHVFISFAVIGIAYNVKMLQAFMILPALFLYYFIAVKIPWKKLLIVFAASLAVLGVFGFTYTFIVDNIPASERPYIGSTEDNSLLDLAFGYNGTERLLGQTTGTGGAFPGMNSETTAKNTTMTFGGVEFTQGKKGAFTPPSGFAGGGAGGPGGGGIGGAFNIGTVGVLRVFQSELGPMASWFLPTAIIGAFVGLFATRKRKQKWLELNDKQKEILLWAGWLVPVAGFFSIASFFHPYYLIMLAPPIAALSAIGIVELIRKLQARAMSWANAVGALLILATYGLQATYTYSYYPTLTIILGILALPLAAFWLFPKVPAVVKAVLSVVLLSIFTGWWALTPTLSHESAQIPTVGPSLLTSQGQGMGNAGGMGGSANSKVLSYTETHQGSATYLFATTNASTAAPYIIASGKSVMALGGFNGTDPSITLAQFKKLVQEGKVKYFYADSMGMGGGSSTGATGQISEIVTWIEANAKTVSSASTSTSSSSATTEVATGSIGSGTTNMTPPNGLGTPPEGMGQAPSTMDQLTSPESSSNLAKLTSAEQKTLQSLMQKSRSSKLSSIEQKELQTLLKKAGINSPESGSAMSSFGNQGNQSGTLYDLTTITNFK